MTLPLALSMFLDGGLSSLEGLRELYLVMFPTALLGFVALVLCAIAGLRKRASERFVRTALVIATLACVASAACALHYSREPGNEGIVWWFALQTAITLAAAVKNVPCRN